MGKDTNVRRTDIREKIFVSIAEGTPERCAALLRGVDRAEVRLDAIQGLTPERARALFTGPSILIATCRPGGRTEDERAELLEAAVEGARYVDIELEADNAFRARVVAAARAVRCEVIVSHHDHEQTPPRAKLEAIVRACFEAGADVAKIACFARDERDAARLLGLLDDHRRMVVIGMGEAGMVTRVMGPLLGAELTFASHDEGAETAPGQLSATALEKRMMMVLGAVTSQSG